MENACKTTYEKFLLSINIDILSDNNTIWKANIFKQL